MLTPCRMGAALAAACLALMTVSAPAFAEKVIWHYDSLPGDMATLANGLKQHPLFAHPGFVKGEAWGQLYKPKAEDYPVKILTVEFVMAQADGQKEQKGDYSIEIYNDDGTGPAPKGPPVYAVTTKDFAAGGNIGQPVVGNNGMIYQFDWSKPENHPPLITAGNIYVAIRYLNETASLENMWGKLECTKMETGLGIDLCGCQNLAALTDSATTPGANLMHIVWPVGTCSGTKAWKFVEQISTTNIQMKGDFILRLGVDGVAPVDSDASSGGGSGGGSDGSSTGGPDVTVTKDTGAAGQPTITGVTPSSGGVDKQPLQIDVYGSNFVAGLKAKLGTEAIAVKAETLTSGMFSATVVGIAAGQYDLVVTNPDGQVAFKVGAFTLLPAAAPDSGGETTAGETAVGAGPLSIDAVNPTCVPADKDTILTILGFGFVKGMKFRVGSAALQAVDVQSPAKATALLPKGLATAEYTVFAELPNGDQKALPNALKVATRCDGAVIPNNANSGCQSGAAGTPWFALLAILAGLVVLRRRALA